MYQARACNYDPELTAAEEGGLNVGADVLDGRSVDPVKLRNIHIVWMAAIHKCKGTALEEIMQRSETPNDAWRSFESHYRARRTGVRFLHEVNGKAMEQGEDSCKFMMETDVPEADLHRLGDRSTTEMKNA